MKLNLLALAFLALPLFTAQGSNTVVTNFTTVQADKANSHPIMSSNSVLLPNGSGIVATGFFTAPDATLSGINNAATWTAALATFSQFGATSTIGQGALNNPGLYKLTASTANAAGSPFEGKNIYTVIGNAATLAGSTQIFIHKGLNTFAVDPTPEAASNYLGAANGTLLAGTPGAPGAFYPAGVMANITTTPTLLKSIGIIPEPTTALLGVLSLGFGFIRRRR